jgi:menaquinone-dependent protoporphyrinogen oxidase
VWYNACFESIRQEKEQPMNTRVLVAYATKYGATAEIAEKIGEVLRSEGLQAEVQPADRATDPGAYATVLLGSAIYAGQWRKEGLKFLETHEQTLSGMPVWFFSSGPTGEGDPVELINGWRFPEAQQPIADRISPRDMAVFHGLIDGDKVNFAEKLIIKALKAPFGDLRDWEVITAWATTIAEELKQEPA